MGRHHAAGDALMTPLYIGDRIRTVIEWDYSHFKGRRGVLLEMRGARPIVHLDGDAAPVLLFAHEVALDETSEVSLMGAE